MPRIGNVLEAAPAVGNVLVLGQRVGDQREQPQVFLEGLGQRQGTRLALGLVRALHQVQRRFQRQCFAIDLETQAGHGLVEQPVEGGGSGLRFFEEQFLQLVIKLIGLFHAQVGNPRPVMPKGRNFHGRFKCRIIDAVQLKLEEKQQCGNFGKFARHIAIELATLRVGGVADIIELRIGPDAADEIGQRLIILQRLRQFGT